MLFVDYLRMIGAWETHDLTTKVSGNGILIEYERPDEMGIDLLFVSKAIVQVSFTTFNG